MSLLLEKDQFVLLFINSNNVIKRKNKIEYKCDTCGKISISQLRAWLERHNIEVKFSLEKLNVKSLDTCLSCAVKKTYTTELRLKRKNIFDKYRNENGKWLCNIFYENCQRCQVLYTKSPTFYQSPFCKKCFLPGKDWFQKMKNEEKIQRCRKMGEKWTGDKNPKFGKPASHGKITKININNVIYSFRSSWEAAFAIYLHENKKEIMYEPRSFNLGVSTYTPDFYVDGIFIEIKGYWRDDAFDKYHKTIDFFPDQKFKLIECNELQNLLGFSPKNKNKIQNYIDKFLIKELIVNV